MRLQKLRLQNFRNYDKREFDFGDETLIVGLNGSGKSNLLEGVNLIARGESFRAGKIEEMVRWDKEVGRVKGRVITEGTEGKPESTDIEVVLTGPAFAEATAGKGEGRTKRRYFINGVAKRWMDFAGKLAVVLFRPEDLQLIEGEPSERRNWLNVVLAGVDKEYLRSQLAYEKGLRRRNKILDLIREGEVGRTQLAFWDQLLIRHGTVLTNKRRELVDYVNQYWRETDNNLSLEYDFSGISEARLVQYKEEEVAVGYTLVGPHKDDLIFKEGERNLAVYGSRGEQRMAVLWTKMAELDFIQDKLKERPVLLLDDIFSELDKKHRQIVMGLTEKQQTIMTATEARFLGKIERVEVISLS